MAGQVAALDRAEGDLDALLSRIAHIRTWTYVSHRARRGSPTRTMAGEDPRGIEDRLSDALHERLTEEFVDRRSAVVARYDPDSLQVEVAADGELFVQGLSAGRLEGFRFQPDASLREEARGLLAAANRGLRSAMRDRVRACEEAPDAAFSVQAEGQLLFQGAAVGRLLPGDSLLAPQIEALASELLEPPAREAVRRRLVAFVDGLVSRTLAPLVLLRDEPLLGPARGLAFALVENLGSVERRDVAEQLRALRPEDRRQLSRMGVTLGRQGLFLKALLRPEAIRLRVALASGRFGKPRGALPDAGASLPASPAESPFYRACGYLPAGPRLLRADVLDRFATDMARAGARGPFRPDPASARTLGCSPTEVPLVLRTLGFVERGGGFFVAGRGEGRQARRA